MLFKHHDGTTKKLVEAFHTQIRGSDCVSPPSLGISEKEVTLLKRKGGRYGAEGLLWSLYLFKFTARTRACLSFLSLF